jgi:hypothetical protein
MSFCSQNVNVFFFFNISYFYLDTNTISLQDSDSDFEVFELFDPASAGKVVGRISLSCSVEVRSMQFTLPLNSETSECADNL